MKFKIGDYVKCVNFSGDCSLELNKCYRVTGYNTNYNPITDIFVDSGPSWHESRFVLMEEVPAKYGNVKAGDWVVPVPGETNFEREYGFRTPMKVTRADDYIHIDNGGEWSYFRFNKLVEKVPMEKSQPTIKAGDVLKCGPYLYVATSDSYKETNEYVDVNGLTKQSVTSFKKIDWSPKFKKGDNIMLRDGLTVFVAKADSYICDKTRVEMVDMTLNGVYCGPPGRASNYEKYTHTPTFKAGEHGTDMALGQYIYYFSGDSFWNHEKQREEVPIDKVFYIKSKNYTNMSFNGVVSCLKKISQKEVDKLTFTPTFKKGDIVYFRERTHILYKLSKNSFMCGSLEYLHISEEKDLNKGNTWKEYGYPDIKFEATDFTLYKEPPFIPSFRKGQLVTDTTKTYLYTVDDDSYILNEKEYVNVTCKSSGLKTARMACQCILVNV